MRANASVATSAEALSLDPADSRALGRWAMILVVCTECAFFAYLIFGYFYLRSMADGRWPPLGDPSLQLALPNTVVLLASSVTLWWGERGIRRGSQSTLRAGLLLTFILGVAFLAVQLAEYGQQRFTPATDAYGSLFFTITGFHGAHVAAGLLMNAVVQVRAWRGAFSARRHLAVSNAALYWHFVDAVWIVVFFSLYLSPRVL